MLQKLDKFLNSFYKFSVYLAAIFLILILVNIVLGLQDSIVASDLNSDGITNVLDVVILVNMILS